MSSVGLKRRDAATKMRNCNAELSHVIPSSFGCDGRGWFYWSQVAITHLHFHHRHPREGWDALLRVNFRWLTRFHSSATVPAYRFIWITLSWSHLPLPPILNFVPEKLILLRNWRVVAFIPFVQTISFVLHLNLEIKKSHPIAGTFI